MFRSVRIVTVNQEQRFEKVDAKISYVESRW